MSVCGVRISVEMMSLADVARVADLAGGTLSQAELPGGWWLVYGDPGHIDLAMMKVTLGRQPRPVPREATEAGRASDA